MSAHQMPARKRSLMDRLFGVRRDAEAEAKSDADRAAAEQAQQLADEIDVTTCAKVKRHRDETDTRMRQVTATSEDLATVFLPTNGKSIEERLADERDEAAAS